MLRVTVELLPFGEEQGRRTLTVFDIANDGTGTSERGNYKARKSPEAEWTEKLVTNYPRKSYHVRELVYRVLKAWKHGTS